MLAFINPDQSESNCFRIEGANKPGRPRKGSKKELLNEEDLRTLKSLSINAIISADRRINDTVERWANKRAQSRINGHTQSTSIAFGLLVGLVHPIVVRKLQHSSKNPIKGIKESQIHILLSAWTAGQLNNNVFRAKQVLPFLSSRGKYNSTERLQREISDLISHGLIQELDYIQVNQITGLVPSNTGKPGRPLKYYSFTQIGSSFLREYFKLYNKVHSEITGNFWSTDLEKLS